MRPQLIITNKKHNYIIIYILYILYVLYILYIIYKKKEQNKYMNK